MIEFVKSKGIEVRFSSEDSFRSDLVDLLSIYRAVDKIGVNRVGIADTVGCANPRQVYELVRTLRGVVSCDIEGHFHDDSGCCGCYFSLSRHHFSAFRALLILPLHGMHPSFDIASYRQRFLCPGSRSDARRHLCSWNRRTKRNHCRSRSHTSTPSTRNKPPVLTIPRIIETQPLGGFLARMYTVDPEGVKAKYKLPMLRDLENLIADAVSVQIPFNNPITGFCAFTHKAGIHAKAILANPSTYEILKPEGESVRFEYTNSPPCSRFGPHRF